MATDAPARIIREAQISTQIAPGPIGPFELDGDLVAADGRHNLRVTVDIDHDGAIGAGDLISTQTHSILPGEQRITVPLTRIAETGSPAGRCDRETRW
jgi:hypothetical protein